MFLHPAEVVVESLGHTAHSSLALGEIGSFIAGALLCRCRLYSAR